MNKRYAISLLWEKTEHYNSSTTTTRELGLYIREGITMNDALATAIREGFNTLRGYHLSLYSIREIPDQEAGQDEKK